MKTLREKVESHTGVTVLMDIEFGHKAAVWLVPMTGEALERWWEAQESFGAPAALWRLIAEYPLKSVKLPGERVYLETDEDADVWDEIFETGTAYSCHFFDDEFTYLTTPDERTIHHKGYCGRDRTGG